MSKYFKYLIIIIIILFLFFVFIPDSWFGYIFNEEGFINQGKENFIDYNETTGGGLLLDGSVSIPDGKGGFEKILRPSEAPGHEIVPNSMYQIADVEGIGRTCNWCRVVREINKPKTSFVTCSLYQAFTRFPYWFKSPSIKQGFDIGRHGYMNELGTTGVDSYCRLIIDKNIERGLGRAPVWKISCNLTEGMAISDKEVMDPEPPKDILEIAKHYNGCIAWFPFRTPNTNEIIRDLQVLNSGGVNFIQDKEVKNDDIVKTGNYYWDGGKKSMLMLEKMSWQYMKSVCCWVKMEVNENGEFKRWSKIFDFYGAPYKSHFFLGNEDVTSNLVMEFWHSTSRMMRLRVKDFFPKNEWVHICITADDPLSLRPSWIVYKNGTQIYKHEDGHIPDTRIVRVHNIGQSGDSDDEDFKGHIRDLRFYETPLDTSKINSIMNYYKPI